jgi:hypothetical protein
MYSPYVHAWDNDSCVSYGTYSLTNHIARQKGHQASVTEAPERNEPRFSAQGPRAGISSNLAQWCWLKVASEYLGVPTT